MGEQHFNFLAQSSRDAAFPRACDLACHVTGAFVDRSQAMLIAARSSKLRAFCSLALAMAVRNASSAGAVFAGSCFSAL